VRETTIDDRIFLTAAALKPRRRKERKEIRKGISKVKNGLCVVFAASASLRFQLG
jgi:hypothetical protein